MQPKTAKPPALAVGSFTEPQAHARIACAVCGTPLTTARRRSHAQLRHYFHVIRAFHTHWPEYVDQQFGSAEDLRKWAQMKCGHYSVAARIPLSGEQSIAQLGSRMGLIIQAAFAGAGQYAWPKIVGDELLIYVPKSIAFGRLSHSEATTLFNVVVALLEATSGLTHDDVMAAAEAA